MRMQFYARWGLVACWVIGLLAASGCGGKETPEPAGGPIATAPTVLKDEIPSNELAAVMAAHYAGLGHMERYEYAEAMGAFRDVCKRAPGWIPGSINLAIALLNDSGVKAEKAKKSGGEAPPDHFGEALDVLARVLEREPGNPYAHFCRGVILEQQGKLAEAHGHFKRVTEIDPTDAAAWYWMGRTIPEPAQPPEDRLKAMKEKSQQEIELFTKALELNPYLTQAVYGYAMAARFVKSPKERDEWFARFKKINPDQDGSTAAPGPGDSLAKAYGEMGRYGSIVNPFPQLAKVETTKGPAPQFEIARALDVKLGEGERWVKPTDFTGKLALMGRIRARFGPAVAAFDADGDGKLDLYLGAAVFGPKGVRDVLLINKGEGRFEDGSVAFGLAIDRGSIGVAAADFDADRHIDLFLTGAGENRLLRNIDGKKFEDISSTVEADGYAGRFADGAMARPRSGRRPGSVRRELLCGRAGGQGVRRGRGAARGCGECGLSQRRPAGVRRGGGNDPGPAPAATAYGRTTVARIVDRARTLAGGRRIARGCKGPHRHRGARRRQRSRPRPGALLPIRRLRWPCSTIGWACFTRCRSRGSPAAANVSGILATNTSTQTVEPTWSSACSTGRCRPGETSRRLAAVDKTKIAFEPWPINAIGLERDAGDRSGPRRSNGPSGAARCSEQAGRICFAGVGQK